LQTRLAREEELLQESAHSRQAKRTDRILALVREWLGPITKEQEQEVTRLAMTFPDSLPAWYSHQLQRNDQLIALMESRNSGDTSVRLHQWLVDQDKNADPRFMEASVQLKQHLGELILTLDRLATSDQRHHVLSRLDDLAQTIHSLRQT
jgi:hypothetical protein